MMMVVVQVEFPEARIYEETLNVLLYENRDSRPDDELMKRTKNNPKREDSDDDLDDRVASTSAAAGNNTEKADRTSKRK